MNLLVDMRGAQKWRERGIPRYIQNFIFSLLEKKTYTINVLIDAELEHPIWFEEISQLCNVVDVNNIPRNEFYEVFLIGWVCFYSEAKEICLFERVFPKGLKRSQFGKVGAIVYDFIPWKFPHHYLRREADRNSYLEGLDFLLHLDFIFTISEDVAQNAEVLFDGYDKKPEIINLNGGVGFHKGNVPSVSIDVEGFLQKRGLQKKQYWIYVGGDEYRKNLPKLIEAQKRRDNPSKLPLVIVCSLSEERKKALLENVPAGTAVVTGYVSDMELLALVGNAFGSVFVSSSEGLGLPLLEAYSMGTPVLSANNSSLKYLAPSSCLIDLDIDDGIERKMSWAELNQSLFLDESLAFWNRIKTKYNWSYSAEVAESYFNANKVDLKNKQSSFKYSKFDSVWVSVLPPAETGIAEYNKKIQESCDRILFLSTNISSVNVDQAKNILSHEDYYLYEDSLTQKPHIFIFGNSHHHIPALVFLSELKKRKNINAFGYFHEAQVLNIWFSLLGGLDELKNFLILFYPEHQGSITRAEGIKQIAEAGIHGIVPFAKMGLVDTFLVNSNYAKNLIEKELLGLSIKVEKIFLPVATNKAKDGKAHVVSEKFTIGSFGIADSIKQSEKVLDAARGLKSKGHDIRLIFVGYNLSYIRKLLTNDEKFWIDLYEKVEETDLLKFMTQVDVAIQLRDKTFGEASGVVCQLLGLEIPTVCTDIGWFSEYGDFVDLVSKAVTAEELSGIIEEKMKNRNLKYKSRDLEQFSLASFVKKIDYLGTPESILK